MDAIELLKADHNKVTALFKEAKATEDENKKHGLFVRLHIRINQESVFI